MEDCCTRRINNDNERVGTCQGREAHIAQACENLDKAIMGNLFSIL